MTHRKRHRRIKLRSLYNWHRYIGLVAALFVLLLSVTGIMLNHTEDLALDENRVASGWLLDWYGIEAPRQLRSFHAAPFWITQADAQLFLDDQVIDTETDTQTLLVGALRSRELLVIALRDTMLLYTADGEFIERLGRSHGLPAAIAHLGITPDNVICVRAADGIYSTDAEFSQWQREDCAGVHWSIPTATPAPLAAQISAQYRSEQISWERVTLDLHSGRLFGEQGVLVMDAAAILFAFLAISGILLWLIRIYKQRQHHPHRRKER